MIGCGARYRLGSVELLQAQPAFEQSFEPRGEAFAIGAYALLAIALGLCTFWVVSSSVACLARALRSRNPESCLLFHAIRLALYPLVTDINNRIAWVVLCPIPNFSPVCTGCWNTTI